MLAAGRRSPGLLLTLDGLHEAAAEIAHHRRALRHLRSTRSHALEANKRHIEAANRIISQKCGSSRDTADDVDPGAAPDMSGVAAVSEVPQSAVEIEGMQNGTLIGLRFSPAPKFGLSSIQSEEAARVEVLQKAQQQRGKALPHGSGATRFKQLERRRSSSASQV